MSTRLYLLGVLSVCAACSAETGGVKHAGGTNSGGAAGGGMAGSAGSAGNGGAAGTGGGTAGSGGKSGSGGTSGSAGAAGSSGSTGSGFACPAGSEGLTLALAGVALSPVAGVPPADGYSPSGNIEGPVWINGALYVSQIKNPPNPPPSRILKIVPGTSVEPFIDSSGTNGLAVDDKGALIGAVHKDGSVSRFNLSNPMAAAAPIVSMYTGKRFNSPNDLAVRSDGTIYFSDPDWQASGPQLPERAYRARPNDPNVEPIGQYDAQGGAPPQYVQKPNGVTLSRDEQTLYIGGTGGLFKFAVAADGAVAIGTRVNAVNGGVDGMTKDCAGNLFVTNGQKVVVLGPSDALIGDIQMNGIDVTNVAFGGTDHKTLFITSMGNPPKLSQVTLNVPGYPY